MSFRFMLGFLIGVALGASLALTLASQSGEATRHQLWDKLREKRAHGDPA